MVQDQEGSQWAGARQLLVEPPELLGLQASVVSSGGGAVQHDDSYATDVVHSIVWRVGADVTRRGAEQLRPERDALIMITHRVDDLSAQQFGRGRNQLAQATV